MAHPVYTYKGFKLYNIQAGLYSINRLARGEYVGKNAREAFHNWVDENYGNAYARKS